MQIVTPSFLRNFTCQKCDGNFGEAVGQEERSWDEVKTVMEFGEAVGQEERSWDEVKTVMEFACLLTG